MPQLFKKNDFIGPDSGFSAGYYMEHRTNTMHSHEFWELSYVYEGSGIHKTVNGISTEITKGNFLIISPGPAHCIISPPPEKGNLVKTCNILLTPKLINHLSTKLKEISSLTEYEFLQILLNQSDILEMLNDSTGCILRFMINITHEYSHPTLCSQDIIENELINLLISICRIYEDKKNGVHPAGSDTDLINELTHFIDTNYGTELSLTFLAKHVHLSREHLSRLFKKRTGENLSTYISNTRIEKAKYLLRYSNMPIGEVALSCGFSGNNNFEKAFKKKTGTTAGEYRRKEFS